MNRGFSLIEVVTAIAIVTIVIGAGVPVVLRTLEASEERLTEERLKLIAAAIDAFHRDHGRLPTAAEGLDALRNDSGDAAWRGPYVAPGDSDAAVLLDGRGGAFVYTTNGLSATVDAPNFPDLTTTVVAAALSQDWVDRAQDELALLNDAAERFRVGAGRYPNAIGEIVPGLLGGDYRSDPWGRDYAIDAGTQSFYCVGPDGSGGNGDDIYPVGM